MKEAIQLRERARALESEGKLEEARSACCEALRLIEVCLGAASLAAAELLNDLACLDKERLAFHLAEESAKRALAIERSPDCSSPAEAVASMQLETLALLGELRRTLGDYPQAEEHLSEALTVANAVFGEVSEEFAEALVNQAALYKYWGRFDEGIALQERSLKLIRELQSDQNLIQAVDA